MMQTTYEPMQFAFYFGLVNQVRGIGEQSPLGGGRETFDLNPTIGTAYPITGFVFLNVLGIYTDPMGSAFGRFVICTQEFGHNTLALLRVPPLPGWMTNDAGDPDDAAAKTRDRPSGTGSRRRCSVDSARTGALHELGRLARWRATSGKRSNPASSAPARRASASRRSTCTCWD